MLEQPELLTIQVRLLIGRRHAGVRDTAKLGLVLVDLDDPETPNADGPQLLRERTALHALPSLTGLEPLGPSPVSKPHTPCMHSHSPMIQMILLPLLPLPDPVALLDGDESQ